MIILAALIILYLIVIYNDQVTANTSLSSESRPMPSISELKLAVLINKSLESIGYAYCYDFFRHDSEYLDKLVKIGVLTKLPPVIPPSTRGGYAYDKTVDCGQIKDLVECTRSSGAGDYYIPYQLTAKGAEIRRTDENNYPRLCYASAKLNKILSWKWVYNDSDRLVGVTFTVKPDKIASWAYELGYSTEPKSESIYIVYAKFESKMF